MNIKRVGNYVLSWRTVGATDLVMQSDHALELIHTMVLFFKMMRYSKVNTIDIDSCNRSVELC